MTTSLNMVQRSEDCFTDSQATTFCKHCNTQLSYPQGATLIQCPKCQSTMNPLAPHHTPCDACKTLLAHPPNSMYIQCPKCFSTMNVRECRTRMASSSPPAMTSDSPLPMPDMPNHLDMHHSILNDSHPKPAKKKRDPNAPRPSINAYMVFSKKCRPSVIEKFPDLPFGKIGAKLGEIWRTMNAEEKKPYEDVAEVDKERFRKEMAAYKQGIIPDSASSRKKKMSRSSHYAPGRHDSPGDEGENGGETLMSLKNSVLNAVKQEEDALKSVSLGLGDVFAAEGESV